MVLVGKPSDYDDSSFIHSLITTRAATVYRRWYCFQ